MDLDLDVDMAQLEINEKKRIASGLLKHTLNSDHSTSGPETDENTVRPRRSSRKKIKPLEIEKRRVLTKPKKLLNTSSAKEINNYYLDKRVKRLPPVLETIFEEPKGNAFMSTKKLRRCIQFRDLDVKKDKLKVKKRTMKAKKICVIKRLNKQVAMELLQKKLSSIEEDDEPVDDKGSTQVS